LRVWQSQWQFPAIPQDAVNEFYGLEGNINLDYLRSAKTADIATEVDNDDKSVDLEMPGLQTRHSEDTSSVDDSDYDKKPTKAPTTIQWKVSIDDSAWVEFTCWCVREQHTKCYAKCLHNRQKRAALKKECRQTFCSVYWNAVIKKEPDTMEDNAVKFFPTDPHPFRTGTIVEENGFLFKEREMDGLIFYDSLEVLVNPDKTLDIIKDSDQYWTTCSGAPSLTSIICFVDTESNTDYLNDLSVFRPTKHEYWNDWLLDEPTRRILVISLR
jgi:hypothetical protein